MVTFRRTGWLASVCVLASFLSEGAARAADPALFRPAATKAAAPTTVKTKRARVLTIEPKRLVRQATDAESTIRLNLFPDVDLEGLVETTRVDGPKSFVTHGRIAWTRHDSFVFVVREGVIAGTVSLGELRYRVVSLPGSADQVVVTELVIPDKPDCACGAEHAVAAPPAQRQAVPADDGSQIDVLVAYTQKARSTVGGTAQMQALIALAVEESNTAYQLSNVTQRLRLVHSVETSYDETSGFNAALNALTNKTDGKMDELHALRNQYGADLVCLLIDNSEYCGLAWLMATESPAFESSAFSVVYYDCATGYYSFAHELGHTMGLNHDLANASGGAARPFGYGYRWIGTSGSTWRSIMAYAPGTRVPRHSNPDVTYDGAPSGTTNLENAARSLNETRFTIANFRDSTISAPPLITSPATATGTVHQSFSYQITATRNPFTYGATGLPAGLNVNQLTGLISGTPTQSGQFPVLLSAANGNGTGTLTLQLTINPDSGGCPARLLVQLREKLGVALPLRLGSVDEALPALRTLRDRLLLTRPAGRKLVAEYYQHGPALAQLLIDQPALAQRALPLLLELLPAIRQGVEAEGRFQLSRAQHDAVLHWLDAAGRDAPPQTKGWLAEVRALVADAAQPAADDLVSLDVASALGQP